MGYYRSCRSEYHRGARLRAWFAAVLLTLALPRESSACNVPVFRYAMERWEADSYQVVVYDHGKPRGEALNTLRKSNSANFSIRLVDVTTPEGSAAAARRKIAGYPWVEVYYPAHFRIPAPISAGALTQERAERIVSSPTRVRLAQKLLAGDVAVWVLVKSGDREKDSRASDVLRTELDRAASALRIPETGVDAEGNAIQVTDFKHYAVRFDLVEISRDDAGEELLAAALLHSEADLAGYHEPLAFPVFGRGRALYGLVGSGIQEKNIREACESMLGWCSCEIKAQNPGTDLLIAADWSRPFGGRMVKDPEPVLTGLGAFVERQQPPKQAAAPPALCKLERPKAGEAVREPAVPAAPAPAQPGPLARNLTYLAGAGALALAGLSWMATKRSKN